MMGSRSWFRHTISFTVPDSGTADIIIRVKSKWPRAKDFFIDGVTLEAAENIVEELPDDSIIVSKTAVTLHLPAALNLQIVTTTCHTPGVVVVSLPEGVNVEIK
jgi:hypothetical protein